jgi:cytochrome c
MNPLLSCAPLLDSSKPSKPTSRRCRYLVSTLALRVAVFAVTALTLSGQAYAAGDAALGKTLYQTQCAACHALDFNGVGPSHRGVFGRQAGKVASYNYSASLKSSGLVWNDANLERWLADPEKLVPGQKMGLNVAQEKDRADIIAFIKQIPAKKE